MLWTLVYIIMTQGGAGGIEMDTWPTGLRFDSQQACSEAANAAAPGLMTSEAAYVGPSGFGGPTPNAVTIRPVCFPTAK